MLSERQWEVVTAHGGEQGVQKWLKGDFDLIFMDLQMPRMDGLEATRLIRQHEAGSGARIPIIALTAHVRLEDRELCWAAGMDDFLSKPIKREKIQSLVARHLADK
jgi:CheY-like chemotaxis protein